MTLCRTLRRAAKIFLNMAFKERRQYCTISTLRYAVRTTQFMQGRTTRWGIAWSFATDAEGTGATPLKPGAGQGSTAPLVGVKPCYRMTFEMQVSRSSGIGAGDVIRDLRAALTSAGCIIEDAAAADPLRLRCISGGGVDGADGVRFSATVMQPAPGSLMVSATADNGPKTDVRRQNLFARAMVAARTRMLEKRSSRVGG